MRLEIRSSGEMTDSERQQVAHLIGRVFGAEVAGYAWADVDWHVLVWIDAELAGHVEIVERTSTVGSRPVRLGGIGGVATVTEWRGRGLATVAIEKAAEFMCDRLHVEFGLLICAEEMTPFYGRLGWKVVEGPLLFDQPSGKVTFDSAVMVLSCTGQEWPVGTIDLCGLPW